MDMNVDVPAEMQRQNTVKDAQMQRQVQMIHQMPSGIHSKVQNMLMPGSSEAAVQSPGPVLQTLERERRGSMRAPSAFSRRCTARLVKTFFRKEGAHRRPQTKSRQNSEMWGRPRNSARDTAKQEERAQQIASVIENLSPSAEAMTQRSWRTDQTKRTAFSPHRQQNALRKTTRPRNPSTYREPTITQWWCWRCQTRRPGSCELPQCDAGGCRDGTTAKEPVVRRRKVATRVRGPREEHTQQQGKIKRTERE